VTDGRTDRILITIPRLHYMQRGKNDYYNDDDNTGDDDDDDADTVI